MFYGDVSDMERRTHDAAFILTMVETTTYKTFRLNENQASIVLRSLA